MSLAQGDTFPTFEAFSEAIASYEKTTGVLFVTYGSEKNKDSATNTEFPYQCIRYRCKQGKIRPSQSKGVRVNQSSFKQGCTASLRAQLQREGTVCMKISVFRDTHNHPVNKEIASFYPENRRIELDENDTNILKFQTAKPVEIKNYLQQKYNKNVLPRTVYNMKQKVRPVVCTDNEEIQSTMIPLKNNGGMYHIQKTEDGSLLSLSFQTKEQLSLLQKYPEVIVMDFTYKTNSSLMPLLTIHAID